MNQEAKLIGKSLPIQELRHFIKKAANTDANILFLGETGVGKELAAISIHSNSYRKNKPFIKINCANLNENLLESELFGYKKGSYTGAVFDKKGLLEEANGGTFFLDEVADMTPHLQAKFLAVIEDKELRRLGENKNREIDVRFIFATNKKLQTLIKNSKFRQDLYYRISILKFFIQPLRKRKEDIPLIIESILRNLNKKFKQTKTISKNAINKLLNYSYPGNIRELDNMIQKSHFLSDKKEIIESDILFDIQEKEDLFDTPFRLYEKMVKGKMNFWEVVHYPFLRRELNKNEVKEILNIGYEHTNNSYKKLLPLFNIEQTEKNYKKFMKILSTHNLK